MAFQYDTKNQSFRQVMGNGLKYGVPRFQRDYSWRQEQWYDLWQDILEIKRNGFSNDHYMGYLVLKSDDNKNFVIIDGQQRLTTLSIFILSALKLLQDFIAQKGTFEDNKKRMETLRSSFIGFTDSVSLSFKNKLTLNLNNNSYFANYLCQLKSPPQRKVKASEKLLGKALDYFTGELKREHFTNGKEIAEFVENVVDKLVFTTITVGSDSSAYTIFETLNARGVQLSTPDLVKNYIFSLIDSEGQLHDMELTQLEERWSEIIKQLGSHKFSDFIRVDWNSRHQFTRSNHLFREIKKVLNNKNKADHYLDDLQKNSEIYSALKNEGDEFWRVYKKGLYKDKKLILCLKTLNLFNITNPYSALIAFFHKFDHRKFGQFLSDVEALSFRYNVIGNNLPGRQEHIYSEIIQIINSQNCTLEKLRKVLKKIYPSDDLFISSFQEKVFKIRKTDKKIRYILKRIEQHLNKELDISEGLESTLTLEHILPQNPSRDWKSVFENTEEMESCASYMGNMTLLSQSDNNNLGNQSFGTKREEYCKSSLKITKQIASYPEWNKGSILARQKWLAEQAKEIWSIPSL